MKLIVRSASFECLGEVMLFDVSVMIDDKEDRWGFTFKPSQDLCVKFGMPEIGFVVESNRKKEILSIQILLPNPQLAAELSDCLRNYIKEFNHNSI